MLIIDNVILFKSGEWDQRDGSVSKAFADLVEDPAPVPSTHS